MITKRMPASIRNSDAITTRKLCGARAAISAARSRGMHSATYGFAITILPETMWPRNRISPDRLHGRPRRRAAPHLPHNGEDDYVHASLRFLPAADQAGTFIANQFRCRRARNQGVRHSLGVASWPWRSGRGQGERQKSIVYLSGNHGADVKPDYFFRPALRNSGVVSAPLSHAPAAAMQAPGRASSI